MLSDSLFNTRWNDQAWKAERIASDVIRCRRTLMFFSQMAAYYPLPDQITDNMDDFLFDFKHTRCFERPMTHWTTVFGSADFALMNVTVEIPTSSADAEQFLAGCSKHTQWHKIVIKYRGGILHRTGHVHFSEIPLHSALFNTHPAWSSPAQEGARVEARFLELQKPVKALALVFPENLTLTSGSKRPLERELPSLHNKFTLSADDVVVGNDVVRTVRETCRLVTFNTADSGLTNTEWKLQECGDRRSLVTLWHSRLDREFRVVMLLQNNHHEFLLTQSWCANAEIRWPFNYERMARIAMVMLSMCLTPSRNWYNPRAVYRHSSEEVEEPPVRINLPCYVLMWILDWLPEFTHRDEMRKLNCLIGVQKSLRAVEDARAAGPAARTRLATSLSSKKSKK